MEKEPMIKSIKSWVRPIIIKRKFQAYCVGTPKSGTTSLYGMLKDNYRSVHEPRAEPLIKAILARADGELSYDEFARFVRKRDADLWLELESSFVAGFIVDVLSREYPDSKFILTVRNCYSWLDSTFNHQLTSPLLGYQEKLIHWWMGPDRDKHVSEEKILVDNGLNTLDSYLSAWEYQNRRILETVPESRILVLRTDEISQSTDRIAEFLGIPAESVSQSGSHFRKAKKKFNILSGIDADFLEEKVNLRCGDLMGRFYPELKCYGDLFPDQNDGADRN